MTSIDLPNLKTITIGDGSFANSTHFSVSNVDKLDRIIIGNKCFRYVEIFILERLPSLKYLVIGSNSFTQAGNSYAENKSRSFYIINCTMLISIEIGPNSFSDYAGDFVLQNLPALQIIMIGEVNVTSYNFYYSSFKIYSTKKGIESL